MGKSKSRTLFLDTVPGQVSAESSTPDIASLSVQDANGESTQDADGQQEAGRKAKNSEFQTEQTVSTLEIPRWLLVNADSMDGDDEKAGNLVPAENVVLHDFVGYGQTLDARETIDRVDAFLAEQYIATRNLFGASITPVSTATRPGPPSTEQQPQPFVEQLLTDAPMAHSLPDACLYFVLFDLKPVDIVFMKRIMHHVNLIPILAKADTLSINQLWSAKAKILKQLADNEIEFFRFGYTTEDLRAMAAEKLPGGPPFALSTSDLEVEYAGPASASLTDLATAINEGKYAESHSDLRLLQTLLLGSRNRMLHQASVKKFLNRWRSDLGLPLEDLVSGPTGEDGSDNSEEHHQKQEEKREGGGAERGSQEEPPQQQQQQQQAPLQQPLHLHQPYHQLPPALQPQTYQPTSSYTSQKSSSASQDDDGQGTKLSRAQSLARSTAQASKIYTQVGGVPALPSPRSNSSTSTLPNMTPPPSQGAAVHSTTE